MSDDGLEYGDDLGEEILAAFRDLLNRGQQPPPPAWRRSRSSWHPRYINTKRALILTLAFVILAVVLLSASSSSQGTLQPRAVAHSSTSSARRTTPTTTVPDPFGVSQYREKFYLDWAKSEIFQPVFNNAAWERRIKPQVLALTSTQQQLDRLGAEACAILLVIRGTIGDWLDTPLGNRYQLIQELFDQIRQTKLPQALAYSLNAAEYKVCPWLAAEG